MIGHLEPLYRDSNSLFLVSWRDLDIPSGFRWPLIFLPGHSRDIKNRGFFSPIPSLPFPGREIPSYIPTLVYPRNRQNPDSIRNSAGSPDPAPTLTLYIQTYLHSNSAYVRHITARNFFVLSPSSILLFAYLAGQS